MRRRTREQSRQRSRQRRQQDGEKADERLAEAELEALRALRPELPQIRIRMSTIRLFEGFDLRCANAIEFSRQGRLDGRVVVLTWLRQFEEIRLQGFDGRIVENAQEVSVGNIAIILARPLFQAIAKAGERLGVGEVRPICACQRRAVAVLQREQQIVQAVRKDRQRFLHAIELLSRIRAQLRLREMVLHEPGKGLAMHVDILAGHQLLRPSHEGLIVLRLHDAADPALPRQLLIVRPTGRQDTQELYRLCIHVLSLPASRFLRVRRMQGCRSRHIGSRLQGVLCRVQMDGIATADRVQRLYFRGRRRHIAVRSMRGRRSSRAAARRRRRRGRVIVTALMRRMRCMRAMAARVTALMRRMGGVRGMGAVCRKGVVGHQEP